MVIEFFAFKVESYQFSKFHENVAKLDKDNFKRGLTVTFKVRKSSLKFYKLILRVIKQTVCFKIK